MLLCVARDMYALWAGPRGEPIKRREVGLSQNQLRDAVADLCVVQWRPGGHLLGVHMTAYYQIEPGLWQGAMRLVAEEGLPEDVDVVLICAHEVERIDVGYDSGIVKIVFPVPDEPSGLDAETFTRLMDLCFWVARRRVLTVCHMGENRSGLASCLILMARGKTAEEAIAAIRASGPPRSSGKPYLFWNPGFVQQVKAL